MSPGNHEPVLKLGVTELVRFAARTGDLFSDESFGPNAQEGQQGHKQIQRERPAPWQAEVHVSRTLLTGETAVQLSGRIDLINEQASPVIIEEIKTCYGAGHLLPQERKALHWAQLKVYAALYFCAQDDNNDDSVILRICYYDLLSKQISHEESRQKVTDAWAYCEKLLDIYRQWWVQVEHQKIEVIRYCREMNFPFDSYRPMQRELAASVYCKLRDSENLLVEAPTGTGKTLSVLFPALKALGEKHLRQILYLTPKGSAQGNALKALEQLDSEKQVDYLVLQAKDKACPCLSENQNTRSTCQGSNGVCARTQGFLDRLPEARLMALQTRALSTEKIQKIAEAFQLCPFAFSIQLVPWISIIIADVNYYFDPLVRLACFDADDKQRVLITDEIHNLPDRARDMYSAELDSHQCEDVYKNLPQAFTFLKKPLAKLILNLQSLNRAELAEQKIPHNLQYNLQDILKALQQTGDNGFAGGLLDGVPQAYRTWVKQIYRFAAIASLRGNAHRLMLEENDKHRLFKIRCLDASNYLYTLHQRANSSIGFSATLSPPDYNLKQVGFAPNTLALQLPGWFPRQNQLTLCCNYISTDWRERENNLGALAELIELFISVREGHYLVFFPSHQFLLQTLAYYRQLHPQQKIMAQKADASEAERATFIESFLTDPHALLGFAVVGGVFAEGVDYAGEALNGAIIIGTGMPQPSEEQKLMQQHFNNQGLNGFQFAYQFPGFTKVLQAAGRVIRSETDRGVILFVEPRFAREDYQQLLPAHWNTEFCHQAIDIKARLQCFWRREGQKPFKAC